MIIESPHGYRLTIAADGALKVTRSPDGDPIFQSLAPFMRVYSATLTALSTAGSERHDDQFIIKYHTVRPDLLLTMSVRAVEDGFAITITAPAPMTSVTLPVLMSAGAPWYGGGERLIQCWPLDTMSISSDPFIPADHSSDGTLNIATPLWFNSAGAGLLVTEDQGELAWRANYGGDGRLDLSAAAGGHATIMIGRQQRSDPCLSLRLLLAESLPQAFRYALCHIGHPRSAPPHDLFARPIWTTWARYKTGIDARQTLEFAAAIVAHQYPRSVMEIDDRWQRAYGDLIFDGDKFPDPAGMIARLQAQGFRVTLWVPPFFSPHSAAYQEAAAAGYFVRHPADGGPYPIRWWQGWGAMLDLSNPAARAWWLERLRALQTEFGVDGFKFDAGEGNFLPVDALSHDRLTRTNYPDHYAALVGENFAWSEVRSAWRSQHQPLLFRQWDKWSIWGWENGLHATVTQALALSLAGYPFILPDMIGGNAYDNIAPDRELMIRWTQVTALMPAMQFSLPPWEFDEETDAICLAYARRHEALASYLGQLIEEVCAQGEPMIRPLYWHAPAEAETYAIADQFLLGRRYLVAPVLAAGARHRDIYLPAGLWRDCNNGTSHEGGRWLRNYPAPLHELPLFENI